MSVTPPPTPQDIQAQCAKALKALVPSECAKLFVAVSGGSDSMALLDLAAGWTAQKGMTLEVITIDHALREGSDAEARAVAEFSRKRGLTHHLRFWSDWNGKGNLQQKARQARYDFFAQIAGGAPVLLAHTLEDQAETFAMRLARGSGVRGLCAMAQNVRLPTPSGTVHILRPLLQIRRNDLRQHLQENNITWFDDPSNKARQFERVRIREAMGDLSQIGLGPTRLSATASVMARARSALDRRLEAAAKQAVISCAPDAKLDLMALRSFEMETRLYLLSRLIAFCGGQRVTEEALSHLHSALYQGRSFALGHVLFWQNKARPNGIVYITREYVALRDQIEVVAGQRIWDHRWIVGSLPKGAQVAPLDLTQVKSDLSALPHPARKVLPGIFIAGSLKNHGQIVANEASLGDRMLGPFRQSFTHFAVKD